jgi:hypothetical protein
MSNTNFQFKSSKENPKTNMQLKLKNNNKEPHIEFNFNTDMNIEIDNKKYVIDLNLLVNCDVNTEPKIDIQYKVKDVKENPYNFGVNELILFMNDFKTKIDQDIKVHLEKIQDLEQQLNKLQLSDTKQKENKEILAENISDVIIKNRDEISSYDVIRSDTDEVNTALTTEKINKFDEKQIISYLETTKKNKYQPIKTVEKQTEKIDIALEIQNNILGHLKLIISDKPDMIYTNLIYIITDLMKYVETINTEDFDKKKLIIETIREFLKAQNMLTPETETFLETICPELIEVLLLVDKGKISIKKKFNCFVPWCA